MTEAEMTKMADYYATETLVRAVEAVDAMKADVFYREGVWRVEWMLTDFLGREGERLESVLCRWYLNED